MRTPGALGRGSVTGGRLGEVAQHAGSGGPLRVRAPQVLECVDDPPPAVQVVGVTAQRQLPVIDDTQDVFIGDLLTCCTMNRPDAGFVPDRRASRLDPMATLRAE